MLNAFQSSLTKLISLTTSSYSIDDYDDQHARYPDHGELDIKSQKKYLQSAKTFFNNRWKKSMVYSGKFEDYKMLKFIARGSFGKVVLAQSVNEDKLVAVKFILKEQLVKTGHVNHILNEKFVLQALNCPFTIYLMNFFMDNSYLYFVMPFVSGGDMFDLLLKQKVFDESQARFYMAQVILALEFLHYLKLIYRDLKPENILIDYTGYLKLADFGFCKLLKRGRTYTICGTPQYLAPEIILNKGYGFSIDWWSTGVLVYELTTGWPPFDSKDPLKIYEKAAAGSYKMNAKFSDELKDLISNLLQTDLTKRYGNIRGGSETIKNHKWFRTTNWLSILNRKAPPPHVPLENKNSQNKKLDLSEFKFPSIDSEDKYADDFATFQ